MTQTVKRLVACRIDHGSGVAHLRLDRGHKRNAIDRQMIDELSDEIETLRANAAVKAVVLSGGEFFSAGGDVSGLADEEAALRDMLRSARAGTALCQSLSSLPQLTIAAVEGGAIGGGISLAAFCDWRIMASSAWIWAPEAQMGLYFGWKTLPRLTALVGPARAKSIAILNRRHAAEECFAWGFADQLVPDGQSETAALVLARDVAAKPRLAMSLIKRRIEDAVGKSVCAADSEESDLMAAYLDDEGRQARRRMMI